VLHNARKLTTPPTLAWRGCVRTHIRFFLASGILSGYYKRSLKMPLSFVRSVYGRFSAVRALSAAISIATTLTVAAKVSAALALSCASAMSSAVLVAAILAPFFAGRYAILGLSTEVIGAFGTLTTLAYFTIPMTPLLLLGAFLGGIGFGGARSAHSQMEATLLSEDALTRDRELASAEVLLQIAYVAGPAFAFVSSLMMNDSFRLVAVADVVTFVVSGVIFWSLRHRETRPDVPVTLRHYVQGQWAAVKFVVRFRLVFLQLIVAAGNSFILIGLYETLPAWGRDSFGQHAAYGICLIPEISGMVMSIVIARGWVRVPQRRVNLLARVYFALGTLAVLMSFASSAVVVALLIPLGCIYALVAPALTATWVMATPTEDRPNVFSLRTLIALAISPIGTAFLARLTSVHHVWFTGGISTMVCVLIFYPLSKGIDRRLTK
jgi:MFS family permease